MLARHDPGFIRDARSVRTQGKIVPASLEHAHRLTLLLLDDVAEDTAFLADEIFAAGAQLIKHAPRDEHGRGDLRCGMAKLLTGIFAVVLEETDVFDAGVALEVEDALSGHAEKMSNFFVAGAPQMAVVARVLDQYFMRAHGLHAIINAVAAAARFAFNAVERLGMHDGTRRPERAGFVGGFRDHVQGCGRGFAKTAGRFGAWSGLGRVIAGDHPGARNWILAEFHAGRRTPEENRSQPGFLAVIFRRRMRNAAEEGQRALL